AGGVSARFCVRPWSRILVLGTIAAATDRGPAACAAALCCHVNTELAMGKRFFLMFFGFAAGVGATPSLRDPPPVRAQSTERPGNSLDHPIDTPRDLSGLSIKNPRVRVVHTTDPNLEGGSMYLQQVDPWLGYQWGRSLTQRNFRERDGVFGDNGKIDGILLPDGVTKMMDRSPTNSSATCHNVP